MIPALIHHRRKLFCFFFVIALLSAMWMGLLSQEIREKGMTDFSIMQLELPKDAMHLQQTLGAFHQYEVTDTVNTHLWVDFLFMLGAYPGIAVWLLWLRRGSNKNLSRLLAIVAASQLIPLVLDIIENSHLLTAIEGDSLDIPVNTLKNMVYCKFVIAYSGVTLALAMTIKTGIQYLSRSRAAAQEGNALS